jgi:hypothetical protein
MKWGTALLDPSLRPLVAGLTATPSPALVPTAFANRPLDYGRTDASKHIVLMSDGENDNSYRIRSTYYNDSAAEITDGVDYDGDGLIGDRAHWAGNNFWFHLANTVDWTEWDDYYYRKYNRGQGNRWTTDICDAAKAQGITIWTVAFETNWRGRNTLNACATSPAHAFDADGTEISSVFTSIARAIRQVKLTQ